MLGQSTSEVHHVVDDVLGEDSQSSFDFLIECFFLGQGLHHGLEVDWKHYLVRCSRLEMLLSDGTRLETCRVQWSLFHVLVTLAFVVVV